MDEEIKMLVDEEIKAELANLSSYSEDKDYSAAIDNVAKLYRLRMEEMKFELDFEKAIDEHERNEQLKREEFERDEQTKKDQLAEQVKDRYFKLGIAVGQLVLPLIFYGIWMKRGFKFEETGTYTSTTFRGLFNRFRPTK